MEKVRKTERVVAITRLLVERPRHIFSVGNFNEMFGVAKSTLCEDLAAIKEILQKFEMGTLETVAGASGGVCFIPGPGTVEALVLLRSLAARLAEPDRIIPGGFLYMSDLLYTPYLMATVGELFMNRMADLQPDYIMTVETKGIPLAFMTARAFDLPLVTARRGSRVTEGSAVSINYVTGSSKRIQTMSLPKRALPAGSKVLIIDDFMKAGGTARGMVDLVNEFGAEAVGVGVLVATAQPDPKLIEHYTTLLILDAIDEASKKTEIRPA